MANIQDYIQQIVGASTATMKIPADIKDQVLGGLSSSIFGSLTQTAAKAGGLEKVKDLLTGKADAASSPITALAGKLFSDNVIKKLNLGSLAPALTALIPGIMSKLATVIKEQDGDGDVALNAILLSLKGGAGSGLLGAATSTLGGLLGKKK